jgi:hypothetical protein
LNDPDLSDIVAAHFDVEEQCRALEAHVLQRFEAARSVRDAENRRKAYWAVAHAIAGQGRQLISEQSLAAIVASGGNGRFWNKSWSWAEKLQSEVGPLPQSRRVAGLDSGSRANHELRLFNLVLGAVNHVLWDLAPHEFAASRRQYSAGLDGDYPFRWADGTLAMIELDANPDLDAARLEGIRPFLDGARTRDDRARLYHANLYSRRMNERDLTCSHEAALVGQWGVFARRRIPPEMCLGVYGGTLLSQEDLITIADRRYLAKGMATEPEYVVNGENITSLMNTMLVFDVNGRVVAQDTRQHNVLAQPFSGRTASGAVVSLVALFSSCEIEEHAELRWNYGYDEQALVRNGLR